MATTSNKKSTTTTSSTKKDTPATKSASTDDKNPKAASAPKEEKKSETDNTPKAQTKAPGKTCKCEDCSVKYDYQYVRGMGTLVTSIITCEGSVVTSSSTFVPNVRVENDKLVPLN